MSNVSRDSIVSTAPFCLPRDIYTLRITKAERTVSKSSGSPMIQLDAEIVEPETVTVGDTKYQAQGTKCTFFGMLTTTNAKGGPGGLGRVFDLYDRLSIALPRDENGKETINLEAPPLEEFNGLLVRSYLEGEESFYLGKDGKPIVENGKPVSRGYKVKANLENILRRAGEPTSTF